MRTPRAVEGGIVPRLSPGDRNEARDAWAFIGVCTTAWWCARRVARLAKRALR